MDIKKFDALVEKRMASIIDNLVFMEKIITERIERTIPEWPEKITPDMEAPPIDRENELYAINKNLDRDQHGHHLENIAEETHRNERNARRRKLAAPRRKR